MIAYNLKTPITVGDTTYSKLSLRAMRFGDVEAMFDAKNEMNAMRILLSRLAEVPAEVVDSLDLQDVSDLLAELGSRLSIPAAA